MGILCEWLSRSESGSVKPQIGHIGLVGLGASLKERACARESMHASGPVVTIGLCHSTDFTVLKLNNAVH